MTDEIMEGQMSLFDPDTWYGKMLQVHSAPIKEKISEPCLKKQPKLQTKMPMFLDLRAENGVRAGAYWETDGVSLGAYMTHNTMEFHSGENAYVYSLTLAGTQQERYCLNCSEKPLTEIPSKLSWILEQNPDPKYNLSQKACLGILRRAENRGKTLPPMLESALRRQAGVSMDGIFSQSIFSQKTESQNPCMPESAEGVVESPMLCSQEQLVSKSGQENREGGKGILIQNERTGALSTLNNQSVVYGISSYDSNAMKSANPNSGIYKAETSRTLDLNGGSPACNQGGMAVVCLEGNGSRPSHQGDGWHEGDPMYTLNSTEHHAIAIENHPADSRVKISEDGMVQTLSSRMGTGGGNVPMVMEPILLESNQNHATIQTDGVSTALPASMGMGGGYVPMVVEPTVFSETAAARCAQDGRGGVHSQMLADPEGNFVVEPISASKASFFTNANETGIAETLVATDYKDPQIVAYGLDRASYNQGMNAKYDFSVEAEKIGTQVAKGPGAVASFYPQMKAESQCWRKDDISNTLVNGTNPGFQNGICSSVVRRLTPMECERLQGYPDRWTDIGDWVDSKGKKHKGESDAPRYKALGNSIALPFWQWMAERMMPHLGDNPTMASLFDGIGGFPLVFSRCGCQPIWASEIEEFPIAVTKKRFPE